MVPPAGPGCLVTDSEPPAGPTELTSRPLWHGRFGEGPADELLAFTVSLPFDIRLAGDDITGSRAHVRMLERVGLLTGEEASVVAVALVVWKMPVVPKLAPDDVAARFTLL